MDAWDPGARAPAEAAAAAAHLVRYLDRADSIEVVRNVFQNFIKGFGFTSVTCLMLPRDGRMDAESILMSTRPPLFIETYLARGHFRFDPVIKEIARRREAFVWSEIKPKGRRLTRAERKVLRLRATFGLEGGFTVPVRESGGNLGSVNIAGSTAELDDGQRAALILASVYVYYRVCSLRQAPTEPARALPAREIEAMTWIAQGKSDWQVGQILGISEKTVNYHIENVKRKFGVATRVQAVVAAIDRQSCRIDWLEPRRSTGAPRQRVVRTGIRRADRLPAGA